jgi:hypothetical protein
VLARLCVSVCVGVFGGGGNRRGYACLFFSDILAPACVIGLQTTAGNY